MTKQQPKARCLFRAIWIGVICTGLLGVDVRSAQETPKPKNIDELQSAVLAILNKNHVPGAGIALVSSARIIWAGGVGKADIAANRDVTADTMFRVGSISKSFIGLALMKLQEEGKIDLGAWLEDVAPEIEIRNPWEETHPVTVANLLEHSAGFDDMQPSELYNTRDAPGIPLAEVFARFPKPQYVRWPPRTRMAYSNPGYGVVGYIVEKVAGRNYDDYIREAVLIPLGMIQSSFRLTDANRSLLAQGYQAAPPEPVPYREIYLRPAGDLKSSPTEMACFVQMMLNSGGAGDQQLVRPESVRRMEEPQTTLAARAGLKSGYGLGVYASLNHALKEYGHDGGIAGFLSTYRYLSNQGLGYVVLINSSGSGRALRDIVDLVFKYLTSGFRTPQQPAVRLSEAELKNCAGYYQPANARRQAFAFMERLLGGRSVTVVNGTLYQKGWLGRKESLVPVSPTQFRLAKEPEASMIFCSAEDGTKVLAGGSSYYERVSPVWPATRLGLVSLSLLLMLSSPLFALIWAPRKVFRRMKGVKHLHVRVLPLLAVLSFASIVFLFLRILGRGDPGARNLINVTFWAATWLFPLLSVAGLLAALRSFKLEVKLAVRIHSLLVSIACSGIAAYLAFWGFIGVRLWAP